MKAYDIFISYRREGGAQYARIMQLMLQQRGFRVFLDYDELTDGVFGDHIKAAIIEAPVFMLILSRESMHRCMDENDWLRQEILLAIRHNKHIVPVNPDNMFDSLPDDTEVKKLPEEIRNTITNIQYSEINFGQSLGVLVDLMIQNRLRPTLGERVPSANIDTDFHTAQRTLRKKEKTRLFKRVICIFLIILGFCCAFLYSYKKLTMVNHHDLTEQIIKLQNRYRSLHLFLDPDITERQLEAVEDILSKLTEIKKDTLLMSKFEFSTGQWYGINNKTFDYQTKDLPITNVSYGEVYMFLGKLRDLTNLEFSLPSENEWKYAAMGGRFNETTLYAGSNIADNVAWYEDNSGGCAHPSNGQQGKAPNFLDIYDMSGNVSELCNSTFSEGDHSSYTSCGGHFNSPATEITTTSRLAVTTDYKDKTLGFRVVIHIENHF